MLVQDAHLYPREPAGSIAAGHVARDGTAVRQRRVDARCPPAAGQGDGAGGVEVGLAVVPLVEPVLARGMVEADLVVPGRQAGYGVGAVGLGLREARPIGGVVGMVGVDENPARSAAAPGHRALDEGASLQCGIDAGDVAGHGDGHRVEETVLVIVEFAGVILSQLLAHVGGVEVHAVIAGAYPLHGVDAAGAGDRRSHQVEVLVVHVDVDVLEAPGRVPPLDRSRDGTAFQRHVYTGGLLAGDHRHPVGLLDGDLVLVPLEGVGPAVVGVGIPGVRIDV